MEDGNRTGCYDTRTLAHRHERIHSRRFSLGMTSENKLTDKESFPYCSRYSPTSVIKSSLFVVATALMNRDQRHPMSARVVIHHSYIWHLRPITIVWFISQLCNTFRSIISCFCYLRHLVFEMFQYCYSWWQLGDLCVRPWFRDSDWERRSSPSFLTGPKLLSGSYSMLLRNRKEVTTILGVDKV